jgi:hypothetical protein
MAMRPVLLAGLILISNTLVLKAETINLKCVSPTDGTAAFLSIDTEAKSLRLETLHNACYYREGLWEIRAVTTA